MCEYGDDANMQDNAAHAPAMDTFTMCMLILSKDNAIWPIILIYTVHVDIFYDALFGDVQDLLVLCGWFAFAYTCICRMSSKQSYPDIDLCILTVAYWEMMSSLLHDRML